MRKNKQKEKEERRSDKDSKDKEKKEVNLQLKRNAQKDTEKTNQKDVKPLNEVKQPTNELFAKLDFGREKERRVIQTPEKPAEKIQVRTQIDNKDSLKYLSDINEQDTLITQKSPKDLTLEDLSITPSNRKSITSGILSSSLLSIKT